MCLPADVMEIVSSTASVCAVIGMLLVGWDGHHAGCNEYMFHLNKDPPGASKC